jgi:hypothetical protein
MAKKAILDTHGKLLIIPGPGGVEIRCSPGTVALQLGMSESGHLIMPLRPQSADVSQKCLWTTKRIGSGEILEK